ETGGASHLGGRVADGGAGVWPAGSRRGTQALDLPIGAGGRETARQAGTRSIGSGPVRFWGTDRRGKRREACRQLPVDRRDRGNGGSLGAGREERNPARRNPEHAHLDVIQVPD